MSHVARGHAKICEYQSPDTFEGYSDADLGRDLKNRRSLSSTLHCYHGTMVPWGAMKQAKVAPSTDNVDIETLFKLTWKTIVMKRFLEWTGNSRYLGGPTSIHEDNTVALSQIRKDRLIPQINI